MFFYCKSKRSSAKRKTGEKEKHAARHTALSCSTRPLTETQRPLRVWLRFRAFTFWRLAGHCVRALKTLESVAVCINPPEQSPSAAEDFRHRIAACLSHFVAKRRRMSSAIPEIIRNKRGKGVLRRCLFLLNFFGQTKKLNTWKLYFSEKNFCRTVLSLLGSVVPWTALDF